MFPIAAFLIPLLLQLSECSPLPYGVGHSLYSRNATISTSNEIITTSAWMANLDGSLLISNFTIPGTHDTFSRIGTTSTGNFLDDLFFPPINSATQSATATVSQQLMDGIRFFDFRCGYTGFNPLDASATSGTINMRHGAIQLPGLLVEQLEIIKDFLAANPSEALLVSIKWDVSSLSGITVTQVGEPANFSADLMALLESGEHGQWYTDSTVPTLNSVRGKAVLFRRFGSGTAGIDLTAYSQSPSWSTVGNAPTAAANYTIQDVSHLEGVDDKWPIVQAFFENMVAQEGMLFINFLSAEDAPEITPQAFATNVDQKLSDYLSLTGQSRFMGIVLIDFYDMGVTVVGGAEGSMVSRLIARNV